MGGNYMKYKGLTEEQVVENRNKYGNNKLSEMKKESIFQIFIASLGDPIIKILLILLIMLHQIHLYYLMNFAQVLTQLRVRHLQRRF